MSAEVEKVLAAARKEREAGLREVTLQLFDRWRWSAQPVEEPVAAMPFARSELCACTVGESMYALGGEDERRTLAHESGSGKM